MSDLYEIDFDHDHFRWASGLPEWLVKVKEICVVHWRTPVDERGFCPAGEEYDNGEWWEWDCDVRKLEADDE